MQNKQEFCRTDGDITSSASREEEGEDSDEDNDDESEERRRAEGTGVTVGACALFLLILLFVCIWQSLEKQITQENYFACLVNSTWSKQDLTGWYETL